MSSWIHARAACTNVGRLLVTLTAIALALALASPVAVSAVVGHESGIRGKVERLDPDTGGLVVLPGIQVTLWMFRGAWSSPMQTVTDADGGYAFILLDTFTDYVVEYTDATNGTYVTGFWKDGSLATTKAAADRIKFLYDDTRWDTDAVMVAGAVVRGTVRDSAGAALSTVRVNAYKSLGAGSFDSAITASAHTDGSGGYSLTGLPSGAYGLQYVDEGLSAPHWRLPGEAGGAVDKADCAPVAVTAGDPPLTLSDETMLRYGAIDGTVAAGTAGVTGAAIDPYRAEGVGFAYLFAASTTSGNGGAFATPPLSPGRYRVRFNGAGFPVQYHNRSLTIEGGTDVVVSEDQTTTLNAVLVAAESDPPESGVEGVPSGWASAITATITSDDGEGSGVASIHYRLDSSAPTTYTAPVAMVTEGTHTLWYWAVDKFANEETAKSITVMLDRSRPTVSCDAAGLYLDTKSPTITGADSVSGVYEIDYRLDSDPTTTTVPGTSVTLAAVTAPGAHTLRFVARDEAGNLSLPGTASFTIDAPHAVIDSISPRPAIETKTVTFTGHGTDDPRLPHTITAYEWSSSIQGVIGRASTLATAGLTPGTHTISLRVQCSNLTWSDPATFGSTLVITEDKPATPNIIGISPYNLAPNQTVTFEGAPVTPTDAAGHAIVAYEWTSSRDGVLGTSVTTMFTKSGLSVGAHTMSLRVKCANNRWSDSKVAGGAITVMVDSPVAVIDSVLPAPAFDSQSVTFTGHGTDVLPVGHGITQYEWTSSIDGALGTTATLSKSGLTPGTHTIGFRVRCANGAWSAPTTLSPALVIVEDKPVAVFASVSAASTPRDRAVTLTAGGATTDAAGHAIQEYEWSANPDGVLATTTGPTYDASGLTLGTHTLNLRVKCANGRWSDSVTWGSLLTVTEPIEGVQAHIASVAPTNTVETQDVTLIGNGHDDLGHPIIGYQWEIKGGDVFGSAATVTTTTLPVGTHTIRFKVRCENGSWSAWTEYPQTLTIRPDKPVAVIGSITPQSASASQTVTFTAGSATDPAGHLIKEYQWISDGAVLGTRTVRTFTGSNLTTGAHTITLRVRCSNDRWSEPVTYPTKLTIATPVHRPVWRFYNMRNGAHFYTANPDEKEYVRIQLGATYRLETIAYYVDAANTNNNTPLYRFFNVRAGVHFYTANYDEMLSVRANLGQTYRFENAAYNVCPTAADGAIPVFRFFKFKQGVHFYTANPDESVMVQRDLWRTYNYEGINYYVAQ